ncbi:MAG: hypothetical protein N2C12_12130 [Planctomycetales bacterium]
MAGEKPVQSHLYFRIVFFACAGAVAGLMLASLALHEWHIPWAAIVGLALTGSLAAGTDVLIYDSDEWTVLSALLTWLAWFVCLAVLMMGLFLVPYAGLVACAKVLGIWETLGQATFPWTVLPAIVGSGFGYLFWFFLDDY